MNTKRYVIAGAISVAIHAVLFSAIPNTMALAMPIGTDANTVSLNLVTTLRPQPTPTVATPIAESDVHSKRVEKPTERKKLVKTKTPKVPTTTKHKAQPPKPPKPNNKKVKTPTQTQNPPAPVASKKPADKPSKPEKQVNTPSAPSQTTDAASGVNSSPQLVSKPTFATRPSPVSYPRMAKRRGLEGMVMVEVWIDETGQQVKQTLIQSSGANILDNAAIKAIKHWRFSSHIVDGQAIAHRVQIPVRFELN